MLWYTNVHVKMQVKRKFLSRKREDMMQPKIKFFCILIKIIVFSSIFTKIIVFSSILIKIIVFSSIFTKIAVFIKIRQNILYILMTLLEKMNESKFLHLLQYFCEITIKININ